MTTDDNEKLIIDNQEEYLKNLSKSKYLGKAKRMIRVILEDGTVIIGKNRYDALKNKPIEERLKSEKAQIKSFEDYHGITDYLKKIQIEEKRRKDILSELEDRKKQAANNINKSSVWNVFKVYYKQINGVEFIENEDTLKNIKPLILYFARDKSFLDYGFKNEKGVFLSKPSFKKGICIIGGFGNGKSSIMNTFQRMFIGLDDYSFGRFSSNELVRMFEEANKYNHPEMVENFWKLVTKSELYIDDVKAEPEALSYGKRNLLNTIFQERYNKKLKTHISINYAPGHNEKPLEALLEFKAKYSNQVYDRIYEMYNIIEFKGKSFRK
jgi:DNA replication protein DnaC